MIRTIALSFTLFAVSFLGCARQTADELFEEGMSASSDSSSFALAEKSFSTLLKRYPDDPRKDQVLFKLAQMAQITKQHHEAIALYQRLVHEHPQSGKAYQAQFMVGFLYEEELKDTTSAKIAYQRVIDNYPDSDLAKSARICIKHIGQSPEEWITFESATPNEQPDASK